MRRRERRRAICEGNKEGGGFTSSAHDEPDNEPNYQQEHQDERKARECHSDALNLSIITGTQLVCHVQDSHRRGGCQMID